MNSFTSFTADGAPSPLLTAPRTLLPARYQRCILALMVASMDLTPAPVVGPEDGNMASRGVGLYPTGLPSSGNAGPNRTSAARTLARPG